MATESSVAQIRCAVHLSTASDTQAAVAEALSAVREQLAAPASLVMVFASGDHGESLQGCLSKIQETLGAGCVVGCTGESIVGGGREVEASSALSIWAASFPAATVDAFRLSFARTPEGGVIEGWPEPLAGEWPDESLLILVGDPYTFPADFLLERLNEDRPGVKVVGGMASSGSGPGENQLYLHDQAYNDGAVAVLLRGPIGLRTVVSQGCRPIGKPFVVTKAEQNVLVELGGRPALEQLKALFAELPTREQQLFQRGLHVGRVVSEYRETFEAGDFLIRNVIGLDPRRGAIAVGDFIRPGQTVQFHLRDHETADDDLKQLLRGASGEEAATPAGALLFTCNGRGTRLFPAADHDVGCVRAACGPIPVAGFFAAGELGPVGKENFMHGFTASIAVFTNRKS